MFIGPTGPTAHAPSPTSRMNKHTKILSLSLSLIGMFTPSAMAQTAPTMNQPDNGFYQGPDPEWATLHSTDENGTATHRQYHRDAVQAHLSWHAEHRAEQGNAGYIIAHRISHQVRNLQHRAFHSPIVTP